MEYLIQELIPPSHVGKDSFRRMIYKNAGVSGSPNHDYLPSRYRCSRSLIPDLYINCFQNVKNLLKTTAVAFDGSKQIIAGCTTDGWRDRWYGFDYICLTIQWYDSKFDYHRALLALDVFPSDVKKTANKIAEKIRKVFQKIGLDYTKIVFTSDSGANFFNALGPEELGVEHARCFNHDLNNLVKVDMLATPERKYHQLPAQDPRNAFDSFINDSRKMVSRVNHSGIKNKLATAVIDGPNVLLGDAATRWNSTFDMISRVVLRSPQLKEIASSGLYGDTGDLVVETLTNRRIASMSKLVVFLKPFYDATVFMSGQHYPTAILCLAKRAQLMQHLRAATPFCVKEIEDMQSCEQRGQVYKQDPEISRTTAAIDKAKVKGTTSLQQPVGRRNQRLEPTDLHLKANYFDPRVRDMKFLSEADRAVKRPKMKEFVRTELVEMVTAKLHRDITTPPAQIPIATRNADTEDASQFLDLGEDVSFEDASEEDIIVSNEIDLYESYSITMLRKRYGRDRLSQSDWPVVFWKDFSVNMPYLSLLARKYLSFSASNVPSESFFSMTNLILTDKRNRTKPITLERLLYLKLNWASCEVDRVCEEFLSKRRKSRQKLNQRPPSTPGPSTAPEPDDNGDIEMVDVDVRTGTGCPSDTDDDRESTDNDEPELDEQSNPVPKVVRIGANKFTEYPFFIPFSAMLDEESDDTSVQ